MNPVDQADALARFRAAMLPRGLSPEEIIQDGEIHRFRTNDGKPGTKDGAYLYHSDNPAAGGYQNHADGIGWENWCSRTESEVDPAQWREHLARQAADKKRRETKLAQERAEARTRDTQRWNAAKEGPHPYLDKKNILSHGTRVDRVEGEDRLLVPVLDVNGRLHGLQRITPDGTKQFTFRSAKIGHFFIIGEIEGKSHERVVQVEGFGTGATVHESTGDPVVVAFDAGNQPSVAKAIVKKYPMIDLLICGDDDWKIDGNPGVTHGQEAADGARARFVKPVWTGDRPEKSTDMDDLARDEGRAAVKAQIDAAFAAPKVAQAEPVAIGAELLPAREYRFSESEAARRFGDQIRDRARFAADEGQWYYFNGQRYVKDHSGVWLLEQSLLVSRAYAEDGIRHGSNDPQFQARMAMAKAYNALPGRKRLIELARAEPGLKVLSSHFDADPWLLNCLTGTINLKSGQLQPHNPSDLITKLAPVKFDPSATCPRFDQFLQEVITDSETIPWLGKAFGYSATGDCSERAAFFGFGPTSGGKSVLVETMQDVFGDYAVLAPTSLLLEKRGETHPCDKMVLKGARLAVFPELPRGQRFDLPTFKTLTGNDTLTGRAMRENFAAFRPTAKLWMTGNNKPVVSDPDNSTWVRMRVIPVEKSIPEDRQDKDLRRKLMLEAPGILAWIVRGAQSWQREGLGQPAKVRAATTAYKVESDRLGPFFSERCTFAPDCRVSRAALYAAYESWADHEGEHPVSPRDFAEQLRQRGAIEAKVSESNDSVRGWRGVGLVQRYTSGQQFPDNRLEESSRETNRESVSRSVPGVPCLTDAPDALAQIGHCLRVRPGTTASDADKQALVEYFAGLNGTANAVAGRLFDYWRANAAPTVADFLAIETKGRAHA
jgi:P4 family phage/plasmid primase-like protien